MHRIFHMRGKRLLFSLSLLVGITLACNLPGTAAREAETQSLEETRQAVSVQQTVLAISKLTQAAQPQQQLEVLPTQAPAELPTYTPYPTFTTVIQPTLTPQPEPTATPDIDAWKDQAKIVVYEDMRGDFNYLPRVDQALDGLGLTGSNVVRVADAQGNFLRELNSGKGWDLVIVAGESRTAPTGEFWEAIGELVINDDVALIAEVWNMDSYYIGKITPLLTRCGITLHRDWQRDPLGYDLYDYSIYWLEPEHPVFTQPNMVEPLLVSDLNWFYDVGDLIKLKGGDAQILAGTQKKEHSLYGLVTTCMDGRVVWQTFSTHDYPAEDTVALWQNYIDYVLSNRFAVLNTP